jgi:long-chain fatty acid transport protein
MSIFLIRKSMRAGLLSATALIGMTAAAHAAGFYIQEQSVAGLGSAFSGTVTNLNDPSTIFFNPSGMTHLNGTQIQGGVSVLLPRSKLTDTGSTLDVNGPGAGGVTPIGATGFGSTGDGGNPYDPTPVPNGSVSYEAGHNFWIGLSVTAPFGLANEYDDGWFGRYDSTKTELTVMDIQPTVAYKFNDMFSVGAGLNIQHADATLKNTVTNFVTEGESSLKGKDWSTGYTIGAQFRPTAKTTIGASYHSAISHELDGRVEVTGVAGLNADVGAKADLDLPDQASFGIAQKLNDRLTLMGQATWFGWNNFDEIAPVRDDGVAVTPIVQNYQTTWTFAAGAEYVYSDRLTLRGGVQFDQSPTTDEYRTSRTPDGDRTWVSLGSTYGLTPSLDLDLAATYIHLKDEEIHVTRNGGFAAVNADTEGHVGILALGVNYKF